MPDTDPNAQLLADVETANFEIGSAMVAYGETKLGGTDGAPTLSVEPVFREVRCDQGGENILGLYITGYNIKLKAKFKEITKILPVLFPASKKLSSADFNTDLVADGRALAVVGLKRSFTLPKAVPSGNWEYAISGTEEHGIEVEFTAYRDAEGTYLQYVEAAGN